VLKGLQIDYCNVLQTQQNNAGEADCRCESQAAEENPKRNIYYEKEGKVDARTGEIVAFILNCEGMGDCLFAIAVIKKIHSMSGHSSRFVIFTHHPNLFAKCPYVDAAFSILDTAKRAKYEKMIVLFDTSKLAHWTVDTFDFISIPIGIGELSFREKQLEYFPVEEDQSKHFDVVINTSVTWPSRSWSIENWQKVADFVLSQGYSVAVVGKDTYSKADNMLKKSLGLKGCTDLTNKLSLDQTYYAIKNCDLFITCQNGLSVLSGATDTEIIVLDMSIEWSKRAIYRHEDPHYKVSYVKGNCMIYCCSSLECGMFGEFRCIPTVEQVIDVMKRKLNSIKKKSVTSRISVLQDNELKGDTEWIDLIGKRIYLESQCHPHCAEEKSYLYHTFDSGGTEIESLRVIRSLIKLFKPSLVLETGTWQADGTVALGAALKENGFGKLISLEINSQLAENAVRRIKELGLSDYVIVVNQSSLDYIDNLDNSKYKFDFAFFDSASPIRPIEFEKLYKKGMLTDLISFHDTSRLREQTLNIPGEPQDEYVKALDEIEQKYCRGGIEFPFSRGLRVMQLRVDKNPAFLK
jgi:hypothetical protein